MKRHVAIVAAMSLASIVQEPPTWAESSRRDSEEKLLTRTVYVTVQFSVEEKLLDRLRIWIPQDGEAGREEMELSTRPHTFMFTYFPGSEKVFQPELVEVRTQSTGACEGAELDSNFFVTPYGISSTAETIAFDLKDLMRQIRRAKRDLRVSAKLVRLRCPSQAISSEPAPVGAPAK